MLHLHDLPLKLFAEAIRTTVYILNRTINSQVGLVIPYESWFKTKPSVSNLKTFGTLAYIFIDKSERIKFQPKGSRVIFVGYSKTSKGWRFWNPLTDVNSETSAAIFDEVTPYSPSMFLKAQPTLVNIPCSLFSHFVPPHFHVVPLPPPNPPNQQPIIHPVGVSTTTYSLPYLENVSPIDSSISLFLLQFILLYLQNIHILLLIQLDLTRMHLKYQMHQFNPNTRLLPICIVILFPHILLLL